MNDFYTITSPKFPTRKDFQRWHLWCQWHDATELTELDLSDSEINECFYSPNNAGLEVYYPMVRNTLSQDREFLYAEAKFKFSESDHFTGHLSLVQNEVVAAILLNYGTELGFYRNDRIVAEDENPKSIAAICSMMDIDPFCELPYESPVTGRDGLPLRGAIRLL